MYILYEIKKEEDPMDTTAETLFYEVQSEKPLWLIFFIIGIVLMASVLAVLQLFFRIRVGTHPVSNGVLLLIWIGVGLLLPLFFFYSNLRVAVQEDGIHYRYFPFHFREQTIKKEDIQEFRQVIYNPVRDYGGYGIRISRQGRAYNVKGNKGIRITTVGGKNILFGSRIPEKFEEALHSIIDRR